MDEFHFDDDDALVYEDVAEQNTDDMPPVNDGVKKKKTIWLVSAGVFIFVLVAVIVGGRMLGISIDGIGPEMVSMGPDGSSITIYSDDMPEIINDERYPETEPDVSGVFTRRQDNSLFIGTGQITMSAYVDDSTNEVDMSASHDGPIFEVIVTGQTRIFIDKTYSKIDFTEMEELDTIQQILEETTSLDGIMDTSVLRVWGKRSGDRYIAETLIYSEPISIKMPEG